MEYEPYHATFINRTMQLLTQYQKLVMSKVPSSEQFEVTLFINCLLGLLIVPSEKCYTRIPNLSVEELKEWGILPEYVQQPAAQVVTLRKLVRWLRNSTAHGGVTPVGNGSEITDLIFEDTDAGFKAKIPIRQLEKFVSKLCCAVQ